MPGQHFSTNFIQQTTEPVLHRSRARFGLEELYRPALHSAILFQYSLSFLIRTYGLS